MQTTRLLRMSLASAFAALLVGCIDGETPAFFVRDVEPNNTLGAGPEFVLGERVRIDGEISDRDDIDIYRFGPVAPGTVLSLQVDAVARSQLDPLVAAVKADGTLIALNDDDLFFNTLNSFTEFVVREPIDNLNIVVATTDVGSGQGGYRLELVVNAQLDAGPDPDGQLVYLDLRGATNLPERLRVLRLPPFDETVLGAEGRRDDVWDQVLRGLAVRFDGYNVRFITSDQGPPPDGPHSVIYIGGADPTRLGVAGAIDFGNRDPNDVAVVFSGSLEPLAGNFGVTVTALANIIAHETGHLLGLVHVIQPTAIMEAGNGGQLLQLPQRFRSAEVLDLSIATQDAPRALELAVGSAELKANLTPVTERWPMSKAAASLPDCWCETCRKRTVEP